MNRRILLTTLGGAAGGSLLGKADAVLGQPPPNPCIPKAGAVDLGALGLYKAPTSVSDGSAKLKQSFLKGVKTADSALTGVSQDVLDHLNAGYKHALKEKVDNNDFMDDHGKPAAQWVVAVNYAFVLGQLAVYFRHDDPQTGKPGALKPRDVVRAQAKVRRATSSAECDCYINKLKAYQLPAAAPATGGAPPKKTDDPCNPAGPVPGPIDEECPFCD